VHLFYVIKKKVLCDKKDDIQWVQQIICPRVPKKRINFFADRMDDIHGNNKKGGGGGGKVSATGWMNNIHGKNQKAQKKLSCDRMEDIYGNN
jgi:hypothetical protein